MFATGYIQDLPDSRDRAFEKSPLLGTSAAPPSYMAMAERFNIHLQQSAESCVGFSAAECLYAAWRMRGIDKPQVASPLFIWSNARKTHNAEKLNSGTYIRMAMRQMQRLGFCPEEVWPGTGGKDFSLFDRQPSHLAYRAAMDQKLTDLEYYRIIGLGDEREESWKRAISQNNPIIFGVPIERSFFDYTGPDPIPSPDIDADIVGGHAMCALGYDEFGVHGPQTWSPGWGINGWFFMSWRYVREWGLDQWAFKAPQYFSS